MSNAPVPQEPLLLVDEPLRIYVAGPLDADNACLYLSNVSYMLKISNLLRLKGHSPFIPCNDMLLGILVGNMVYSDYFNMSQPWLKASDAMFFIAPSPGANRELATAHLAGIPIFSYLNQVPWVKENYDAMQAQLAERSPVAEPESVPPDSGDTPPPADEGDSEDHPTAPANDGTDSSPEQGPDSGADQGPAD
jgi:hypothetical protein